MIIPEANFVQERTIDEAWRSVMQLCIANGWDFVVKGGSYVGQIRKQLKRVEIIITEPWTRPLSPQLSPPMEAPTNDKKIADYFCDYIFNDTPPGNEEYIYGTWIMAQLQDVIDKLNESHGNTNQACISVGDSTASKMDDPPCLRVIDFKIVDGCLEMTVFFRSWDLYAGLPENLGGLQLLKEYVLSMLEFECNDGPIIAYSSGLHIYEQYFSLANTLNVNKITVSGGAITDKNNFEKKHGI